jgi:hypothetical protein
MQHTIRLTETTAAVLDPCSFPGPVLSLAASRAQAVSAETVIQKATEQFESSPLKTTSLGNGVFIFRGTEEISQPLPMMPAHC